MQSKVATEKVFGINNWLQHQVTMADLFSVVLGHGYVICMVEYNHSGSNNFQCHYFAAFPWRQFHSDWLVPFICNLYCDCTVHFNNRSDSKHSFFFYLMSLNIPIFIVGWFSQHRIWIAPVFDEKPMMWNEVNLEIVQLETQERMCWTLRKWSCLLRARFKKETSLKMRQESPGQQTWSYWMTLLQRPKRQNR